MAGLSRYKRTLAAAPVGRSVIDVRGTTVFLRTADASINVTTRTQQIVDGMGLSYTVEMSPSEKLFAATEFDMVEIENLSALPNTIEILIGYGDFFRPVPDVITVDVDAPIDVNLISSNPSAASSSAVNSVIDINTFGQGNANAVEALAANPNRVRAIVTAHSGNTDVIRVGDSGVDINNGIPLSPGDSVPWDTTDVCHVCSEGVTAAQVLSVIEFNL